MTTAVEQMLAEWHEWSKDEDGINGGDCVDWVGQKVRQIEAELANGPTATVTNWDELGNLDNRSAHPRALLLGTVSINGLMMHVEAIQVTRRGSMQEAIHSDLEDRFTEWYVASGSEGHVQTATIKGRQYALFASPFC